VDNKNKHLCRDKIRSRALLLVVVVVVIGCSKGTLDRKTATEKINEAFSQQRERIPVRIGRVGSHCETRTINGETHDIDLNPATDPAAVIASAGGYIDAVPDGQDFWKVALTERGRAFVKANDVALEPSVDPDHCGYQIYSLPLATAKVNQVTGIIPGDKSSQVEFAWNWALTDLGMALRANGKVYSALTDVQRRSLQDWFSANPGPVLSVPAPSEEDLKREHHDTAQFVKYDDGWRLKK
jgi:hypothetical protein